MIKKVKTKFILFLVFSIFFYLLKIPSISAIPSAYQRCETNSSCTIGEYVFEDDGHTPIITDNFCQITITNPSDGVEVNAANMSDKDDGWYYYSVSGLTAKGLYRALICCDVSGTDEQCIDKSFIVGTSLDNLRKGTFDFNGQADSGTTTTLVDAELIQPDDFWNDYSLIMISGSNIGQEKTVSDFVSSTDTITVSSAFSNAVSAGDEYILKHETSLIKNIWTWTSDTASFFASAAGEIWSYTGASLDTTGNAIAKVWSYATRTLTGNDNFNDPTSAQIASDVWSEASRTLTDYSNDLSASDVWSYATRQLTSRYTNENTPVDLAQVANVSFLATSAELSTTETNLTSEIDANETLINNLNDISASDVWSYANRTITDPDNIWEYALTQIGDTGSIGELLKDNINATISSRSSHSASDVWSVATRTLTGNDNFNDPTSAQIASDVWSEASRTLTDYGNDITALDVWNVLSSTLTTTDSIGEQLSDNIDTTISSRASQTSLDSAQTDITYIRSEIDSVYTDTQHISTTVDNILSNWSSYTASDIIDDLDGIKNLIGASTDSSATETIFGRAKYIQEKWGNQTAENIYNTSNSTLTTINSVQTELGYNGLSSTAKSDLQNIKTYTDNLETYLGSPSDNSSTDSLFGKVAAVKTKLDQLDTLESKLNTVETVVDALSSSSSTISGEISIDETDPIYTLLNNISRDIQVIAGDQGYNLDNLYNISQENSTDLTYLSNKTADLKTVIDINKNLITKIINEPVIKTWYTEGSIILNILVINPPDTERTVTIKEYLPEEIREEHIIELPKELELNYDADLDKYYVTAEVRLKANERIIFKVKAEDIYKISDDKVNNLRNQAKSLMEPLKNTNYFAQASLLKSEIDVNLDTVVRNQEKKLSNVLRKISLFRECQKNLQKVELNLESLKTLNSEVSSQQGILGNLLGVSTTMTWAIIIMLVVGIAVLMILLYVLLAKQRAMEHHISGGEKLKAPPLVDVRKHATRIKGGLITYFLPPFGKPVVELGRLISLIKILLTVGFLIILLFLVIYFYF
ncbi:MAG: hypothetical protein U5L76_02205 [Patescibacteria group bacterium]|nr:hypothetical protein [Patescibacteria group bacterium]